MGREARCFCRWDDAEGEVKALLETEELVLRSDLKRRVAIAAMADVRVEAENLCFTVEGEPVMLALGAIEAARWAQKIATPPPSLRVKLGIEPSAKVLVLGTIDGTPLEEALADQTTTIPGDATLTVAVVGDETQLALAVQAHANLPPGAPLWVVYRKGPSAVFGDGAVRGAMRAVGFIDLKVASVSPDLTATRYTLKR